MRENHTVALAGTARRIITPPAGVELAGLGYYLQRRWNSVRDDLCATAVALENAADQSAIILLALDLMYNSEQLTACIREQVRARTGIPPQHICVNVSHSHNAPTAGLIRGAGEVDPHYIEWVAKQATDAVVEAYESRKPACIFAGESRLDGMTFNRTRADGPVDTTISLLRIQHRDGSPLAAVLNFHSHCTAYMECDLFAVGRDWPGDVVDQLEAALPGCMAMYLQGICGDVNFHREFNGTERNSEPGQAVAGATLEAWQNAAHIPVTTIRAAFKTAHLPTRNWSPEEIATVREECEYRLRTGDTAGWLNGFARAVVNQPERLPLRYGGSVEQAVRAICRFGIEWADQLPAADSGNVTAEVQAIRIGNIYIVTCPGELFTSLGLEVRDRFNVGQLFILSYTNGSIGYIPDAFEIERQGYAAVQSPKFTGQQPFTREAGCVLVDTMLAALEEVKNT